MTDLAICVIVRDEARHIAEWLEFHRLVGVTRFFVYDDRSEDDTLDIVRRHDRGDVVLHTYSDSWHSPIYHSPTRAIFAATPQICAYNHCAHHHAGEARWCAYIDVDEFLYHTRFDNLPTALKPYSVECGVAVNWLVFGSNGHRTRPAGLTIENYTRRGMPGQPHPYGRHIKTIVAGNQIHWWGCNGSHAPIFASGHLPVDMRGRPIAGATTGHPIDEGFVVNHYYHRSYEEAAAKAARVDRNAVPGFQPDAERLRKHDRNEVHDDRILRFSPALQGVLTCDTPSF